MPQQNMTKVLGKSSSPVVDRVIQNNKNVQQPCGGNAPADAHNKQPVKL